jgi:hypothetical protein
LIFFSYHQFVLILQIIQKAQRQTTNDDAKVMKNDENRIDEKLSCNSKTNKSSNEASVSGNEHDTNSVCDQIVADYLKRNGFGDVLSLFQESRQLRTLSNELEIPGRGSTLKRLIKFDRKNRKPPDETLEKSRKPPDECQEKNRKPPDKEEKNKKQPDKTQEKSRKPPDKSQAKSRKEPDKQETSRKPSDKSQEKIRNPPVKTQEKSRKQSECHSDKSQEKSYDSWSNIRDGFSDLEDHLNPDDPNSEVDKLVKHILDINIPIRYFNVKHGALPLKSLYNFDLKDIKKYCPNFKIGRFSRGSTGEDGIIRQNWDKLAKEAQLKNPSKCIEDLMKLDKETEADRVSLKKRNVIGCYLAQKLPNIRYGGDVFQKAVAILYPWNDGKYSKEENEIILKEVEEHGANQNTFRELALLMGRRRSDNIRIHYKLLKESERATRSGRWTLNDFERFFEFIFKEKNTCNETGVAFISSIPTSVIYAAAKVLDRQPHDVYLNWIGHIKPILLSYHSGTLHTEWKPQFFDYLIKNKIVSLQEINWDDAKEKFPNHCARSLEQSLCTIWKIRSYESLPLYLALKDYKEKTKHSNERSAAKKYKEDIVFWYDKARGVSAT